ncbi:hypothetical protein LCGC14_2989810 [marine sediment metagenome]|uniref:Uncharacterized protein n=1 Tax=marine sediment metagenome TaxID=412755 RepID=A0A0F8X488_9ZZZZ
MAETVILDNWAEECLQMVRERLEAYGISMDGCPPMMYDDAISTLVYRLGRHAGLHTVDQIREAVQQRVAAPTEGDET